MVLIAYLDMVLYTVEKAIRVINISCFVDLHGVVVIALECQPEGCEFKSYTCNMELDIQQLA